MSGQVCVLRAGGQALVLAWAEGEIPRWAYWGVEREQLGDPALWQRLRSVNPRARMDNEELPCLAPGLSRGSLHPPILWAHSEAGTFAQHFKTEKVERIDDAVCDISLSDPVAGLRLVLHLDFDGDAQCLQLSTILHNDGPHTWQIQRLCCPSVPLGGQIQEAMAFPGRWAGEFQCERSALGRHAWLIEHREGRSGPQHQPSCVLGSTGFGDDHGELLGAHLGASSNYQLRVERYADGSASLQAGQWLYPGEVSLSPGDCTCTPVLYVARSAAGLNPLRQCFHRHFRRRLLPAWTRRERPIHANSWEAVYFDHRQETLFDLVRAAAALGAERFVLDDGWFLGRRHDRAGLGDWQVCPNTYPQGLHPLVAEVQERGMQFGLWVEPEMVNPDSELARQHPDWVLQLAPYPNPTARHQWVLDLSREAAFQWLRTRLIALLDEYPIAYLKWDMNRPLALPGGECGRAVAQAQAAAVYRLMADLQAHQADLEIESCASGGGRIDAGILRHCGRVWTSDNNDPVMRAQIQANASVFFPPEILGTHVGPERAQISARQSDIVYRVLIALQGQFGFELDARTVSSEDAKVLRRGAQIYRQYRRALAEAQVWRHQHAGVRVCTYVLDEGEAALVWATAEGDLPYSLAGHLKLRGLRDEGRYRVSRLLASAFAEPPDWFVKPPILSAPILAEHGLPLPVMAPQTGLLLSLQWET